MNLVYISTDYAALSVFKSQVHTLCNAHSDKHQVHLIAFCNQEEMAMPLLADTRYQITRIPRLPKLFIPELILFLARKYAAQLKPILSKADLIWCRGHVGTQMASELLHINQLHIPVLADIRGVVVDELREKGGKLARFFAWCAQRLELKVFKNDKNFFFVTQAMDRHYRDLYPQALAHQSESWVFPTVVRDDLFYARSPEIRKQIRQQLGLGDAYTYIYVGGTDYWQNLDQILLHFGQKCGNQAQFHLVVLTKDTQWVHQFIAAMPKPFSNYTVQSAPYEQVGEIMSACDAGLLIRSASIVNQVASPTKKNEYLASGLPICENLEQIGDLSLRADPSQYKPLEQILAEQEGIFAQIARR